MTTLYRVFDASGRLLYVGITDWTPDRRMMEHRYKQAGWAPLAKRFTYEQYDDRESAVAAELSAIRNEDPVWNIEGRPLERYFKWQLAYPDKHADDITDQKLIEDARRAHHKKIAMRSALRPVIARIRRESAAVSRGPGRWAS
jgi:predicted GIY-YIG superfamily endonuclease